MTDLITRLSKLDAPDREVDQSWLSASEFERRSSSASTASRMNFARPYVPTSSSILFTASSGSRTRIGLLFSGGRPIRFGLVDIEKCVNCRSVENN